MPRRKGYCGSCCCDNVEVEVYPQDEMYVEREFCLACLDIGFDPRVHLLGEESRQRNRMIGLLVKTFRYFGQPNR